MKRIVSGMRPTGRLHLGNYEGALKNWVKLQDEYESFHFVADWHALTSDYADTSQIHANSMSIVTEWLAAGLDPVKCVLFIQSLAPEHAELHIYFSAVTPLGWLERVPTYKEQRENITDKDLGNYAFLGYPVLQAADISMYRADYVPVGQDQVAHVELTREIVRRFNNFYGEVFPEPDALLTETPKLIGTDGRKMSKSYNNTIELADSPDVIREKVRQMITDRTRIRRTDPGHPEDCDVCKVHRMFVPAEVADKFDEDCRSAAIGCVDRKRALADALIEYLAPITARLNYYRDHQDEVRDIILDGSRRAREEAGRVMADVRRAMKIAWE
ncbi:MAG: tryptophan--tRNA ligase [Acidobacteriota bacterium]|nr:MAG: tryptophan--tRNA ligase [Acidobacteriota bacterium]